jgi:type III restriction enzyme
VKSSSRQSRSSVELEQGEIKFDLETEKPNYKLRDKYEIEVRADDRPLTRYGSTVQLSLFEPVFEQHFDNDFEKKFAYYLDERRALQWWHRIAVRQRGEYYVQGWKQGRIYPDFVAMTREFEGVTRVLIFETKGEHLGGNLDTEYKKKVLKTLEDTFNAAGTMRVHGEAKREGIFQLVFNTQQFPEITVRLEEDNVMETDN